MKLYVCYGTFTNAPRPGGHPCGNAYRALREAHLTGNFCDHQFCGQCPDWQQTRWPGEGRSYADMIEEFSRSDR